LTDMQFGWVFTRVIRNNASVHMIAASKAAVGCIPYQVTGLDADYADVGIMPTLSGLPG